MTDQEAKELLQKYQAGLCSEEEMAKIESWYFHYGEDTANLPPHILEDMRKQVLENLPGLKPPRRVLKLGIRIITVAACVGLILGTWVYIDKLFKKTPAKSDVKAIVPGGNRAILTLSNGKSIVLSSNRSGLIVNSERIAYNDGSTVVKPALKPVNDATVETIKTPNGGQYQLTLSDGTKIWLNAATTIKFPRSFKGLASRNIELNGEAYFEVAKDKIHPFYVRSKLQELRVLGTHFNISAYPDEPETRSTLLEGSIRINDKTTLIPGEQAKKTATSVYVEPVDTDYSVAWKNGEFMFRKEPLQSIMRKIARWYDVDVVYEDQSQANKLFGGEISRFTKVTEVLNTLQLTGQVSFKIEGRRIMVLSK